VVLVAPIARRPANHRLSLDCFVASPFLLGERGFTMRNARSRTGFWQSAPAGRRRAAPPVCPPFAIHDMQCKGAPGRTPCD
jgi:hypothetical protein